MNPPTCTILERSFACQNCCFPNHCFVASLVPKIKHVVRLFARGVFFCQMTEVVVAQSERSGINYVPFLRDPEILSVCIV